MIHKLALTCLAALVFAACYRTPPAEETASAPVAEPAAEIDLEAEIKASRQAFQEAATPRDKVAVARDFLRRHPESEATLDALDNALHQLIDELDDPRGAEELVNDLRGRIEDPELVGLVSLRLADHYGRAGRREELRQLADELGARGELRYDGHETLARAAARAGDWQMVLRHADAAFPFATPEAYRADQPEADPAAAERAGRYRLAVVHAHRGRALAELGRQEEALAAFRAGAPHATHSYLGADSSPLHRFWGQTLLAAGDVDGAIEKLTPGGLFGREDDREALVAALRARGDDDLEATLWRLRREHARTIDDFVLSDYQGQELRLSDLEGEVVLLAFWFPT